MYCITCCLVACCFGLIGGFGCWLVLCLLFIVGEYVFSCLNFILVLGSLVVCVGFVVCVVWFGFVDFEFVCFLICFVWELIGVYLVVCVVWWCWFLFDCFGFWLLVCVCVFHGFVGFGSIMMIVWLEFVCGFAWLVFILAGWRVLCWLFVLVILFSMFSLFGFYCLVCWCFGFWVFFACF